MMRGIVIALTLMLLACSSKQDRAGERGSTSSIGRQPQTAKKPPPAMVNQRLAVTEQPAGSYSALVVRHVVFHESTGLDLRTQWLRGRLYPAKAGVIPSLDDPNSFQVEIDEGRTDITLPALSAVLTSAVLKNSKLSNLQLSGKGPQELQINAVLHKLIPLPVQMTGTIGATPDGRVSLHITKLKLLKVPFKGLLHAAKLVDIRGSPAVQVNGDSVYLRTDKLLPPPRKLGRVSSVHITQDGSLEENYGRDGAEEPQPDRNGGGEWRNFLRVTGGTIRFGKLTMDNADLVLVDSSPGDWLDFDLAHYHEQLVSGYMHVTPSGGLQVFIPDITKITRAK